MCTYACASSCAPMVRMTMRMRIAHVIGECFLCHNTRTAMKRKANEKKVSDNKTKRPCTKNTAQRTIPDLEEYQLFYSFSSAFAHHYYLSAFGRTGYVFGERATLELKSVINFETGPILYCNLVLIGIPCFPLLRKTHGQKQVH